MAGRCFFWECSSRYNFGIFAVSMSYEIKLPLFEGPFDLLLFFIERDELDIHDIPIAKITDDFLAYLKQLQQLNLEVASEFILVAATLMRIKSRLLLPRPQLDEKGEEIDPREELVQHLLEYKRYKSVVGKLAEWENKRLRQTERGNVVGELTALYDEIDVEAELQHLDLYKLLKVYQRVLERFEQRAAAPRHEVKPYPYTIGEQKGWLRHRLRQVERYGFEELMAENPDRIGVIFNFLAILELLAGGEITITIGEGFNNFWIAPKALKDPSQVDAPSEFDEAVGTADAPERENQA